MYSPFSNYMGPGSAGETESVAFALEPETITPFQETLTIAGERDGEKEYGVQFEGELTENELQQAIKLNDVYQTSLGFDKHVYEIQAYFQELLYGGMPTMMSPSFFAHAVDKYQILRKLKPTNKGAMGIGTWSLLQGELGYHHLSNNHKINLDRAKLRNSFFEKKTWGSNKEEIFNELVKAGILKYPLPLDAGFFALAIAEFQSKKPGLGMDGVLGPKTLAILIPGGLDSKSGKLSDEQLVTRIIEKLKGYSDAYLNGLDSFSIVVANPSKEEIEDMDKEYKKDFYSEIGKLILDHSIEFLSEEIPFIGTAYKLVTTLQDSLKKYREHREAYEKLVLANQLKDFLVDEKNSFGNVHTFFESNQSEMVEIFSKTSKKIPAIRKSLEKTYDSLQGVGWTQEAVFQSICEKWLTENVHHGGIIELDLLVDMEVGRTTISGPFGSRIAERLLKNGGGRLDLEKFKVNRSLVFFPYDKTMDSITWASARLSIIKDPNGQFGLIDSYFPIGSTSDEMDQARTTFTNFIYSHSVPTVIKIESK